MKSNINQLKNLVILLTEITAILLMVFNILPRELSWFLTGLLIFYFIFSPLEDSLWVFIASIPLFVALPIKEGFDTLANWRILSIVLFLVLFFRYGISINLIKDSFGKWRLKEKFEHYRMEYLSLIFIAISFISILVAENAWIGLKKIIFLINASLIYIIIRNLAFRNKNIFNKIYNAVKVAIGITLGAGFLQLIIVFFINLHQFWYLWDLHVINVYYGQALSNLLSYSNTWFSYYLYQLPTLRMFSIFPDSHSFAMFCLLSLPFFWILIFLRKQKNKIKVILSYLLLIFCFLGIIFSGSRGAWVSAICSLLIVLFFIFKLYKNYKKQTQLILGSFLIFIILFPIASAILFLPQYIQLGDEATMGISFFERTRSMFDFMETSVKGRLEIWQRTIDSIIIHPFFGVGIGNYPLILNEGLYTAKMGSSAHSLYLNFASEIGIFGLLILLAMFWYILKDAWQIFNKANKSFLQVWAGFFIIALIWIMGYSLFDVVLLNDKVFLFFLINLGILYGTKSSISFN